MRSMATERGQTGKEWYDEVERRRQKDSTEGGEEATRKRARGKQGLAVWRRGEARRRASGAVGGWC
jgi:hypothetical protein